MVKSKLTYEKTIYPSLTKLSLQLILAAFTLFLTFNSCKKELYNGEKIDPARKKEMLAYKNGPKIEIIDLAQFKNKANLNALGSLKQQFVTVSPSKGVMSITTAETYLGFKIITDSIKVIKDKGHTMYVFPVVLPSKRAVSFQNLTIDESLAGTVAFVNTYTPTKKWISDWKDGHPGKFEGDVKVNYLKLNNGNATSGVSSTNKNNNPPTLAVAQLCTNTTYYFEIPYFCASGQHYPWDEGCTLMGDEAAGYALFEYIGTNCIDVPEPGTGGTTPNPPPGYNPCPKTPEEPPVQYSKKQLGNKIMQLPPSECDSPEVELPEIINNVKEPCLKNIVDLTLNNDITGAIKDIIKNLDKDISVKIKVFDATTTTNGGSGETINTQFTKDPITENVIGFSTNIVLSKDVLLTSSREFTTSVIIHEILHAYFRNNWQTARI
ncbi:MAG: hypothetical protein EOO07_05010 [Chitinophagaceae bacterium]|nr:MAG: hypothetical protein EOO07_05010 [Chitinophagaceae bacterium]